MPKVTELRKLTDSHRLFCRTIIADTKMNQTQAYLDTMAKPGMKRATASKHAVALKKQKLVKIELKRLMQLRSERLDITADKVLAEIASIAFAKTTDYLEYDDEGNVTMKSSDEVDGRPIKSVERRIVSTDEETTTEVFKFKLHDKLKALELTMKHLGLLNDNLINVGKVEVKVQLPPELTEDLIN
ncbi:terminase small subunit [Candidatus Pacearchaeota archaeon]|nr:terminase small subunit [Candidatus Pacearchaeota archaeon]